jgi:hypothetical protein
LNFANEKECNQSSLGKYLNFANEKKSATHHHFSCPCLQELMCVVFVCLCGVCVCVCVYLYLSLALSLNPNPMRKKKPDFEIVAC